MLLAIADHRFLITASHVAVQRAERGLGIAVSGKVVDVLGETLYLHRPGTEIGSDADSVDVAAIVLPPELTSGVERRGFLGLSEVVREIRTDEGPAFAVNGYPRSRQDRRVVGGQVSSQFHPFLAKIAGPDLWRRSGASREHQLVLSYAPPIWSAKGSGKSPSLRGMSGCGMWEFYGPLTAPSREPALAAIFTEWHDRTIKFLLGTRIGVVLEMIQEEIPELRPAINLTGAA